MALQIFNSKDANSSHFRHTLPPTKNAQKILGKVCSTVIRLLNPSWLLNVSPWMGNSEEEEPGEVTIREDNDVVCPSVLNRNKRLRLRFDDHVPSIQSSRTEARVEQSSQNLYETTSRVQSPPSQRFFIKHKKTIAVLNEISCSVSDTSTWKCTSCWVRNPKKENKCLACETLHPNVDKTTALMFKSFDKPTMTSSVCPATTQSSMTSSLLNANTSMSTSSVNFDLDQAQAPSASATPQSETVTAPVSPESCDIGAVKTESQATTALEIPFGSGGFVSKNEATSSALLPITQSATTGCAASTTVPVSSGVFVFGAERDSSSPFIYGSGHYNPQTSSSVPSLVSHSAAQELNGRTSTTNRSGGFVFEIPKTEGLVSTATPFTIASGTPSSNTSAFSAFLPHQASKPTFKFGSQSAGSTATTIGMSSNFSFAKSEASYQITSSVSQNPVSAFGTTNTNFVFGSKSSTSVFGSKSSTSNQITRIVSQSPGPAFGTTMNSESSAIQSMFGGSMFFGTPSAPETNTTFPTGFNTGTPPIFNFGATSTPARGPFQLASMSQNPFYSPLNGNYGGNFTPQPSAPLFGSSAIQSAFGSSSVQSFGGIGQPGGGQFNLAGATLSVFEFYAFNNKERKRTATASGFFETPSALQTNNTFPTDFNMNTPPIFNYGATFTPTAGPFQLAASTAPIPSLPSTATRKILVARRRNT